jgi:hypothetical protein
MENELRATRAGRVATVRVTEGSRSRRGHAAGDRGVIGAEADRRDLPLRARDRHRGGHRPGGGPGQRGQHRPRPLPQGPCRAGRQQLVRSRGAHRPARRAAGRGRFVVEDLVGSTACGPARSPGWSPAYRGVAHVGCALPPRGAARQPRDERLAHGRESFADGRQTFPRVTGPPRAPGRPLAGRHDAAVRARAPRRVVFLDFGSSWSAGRAQLDITVTKLADYRGQVRFSGGTLAIQDYVPMTADGRHLPFEGATLVFDQHGARHRRRRQRSHRRVVEMAQWPEQLYTDPVAHPAAGDAPDLLQATPSPCTARPSSPARFTTSRVDAS